MNKMKGNQFYYYENCGKTSKLNIIGNTFFLTLISTEKNGFVVKEY